METQTELQFNENQKFYSYHKTNPEVYELFKKRTLEAIKRGFKHFSARGIFQVMRFFNKGSIKKDGYKLNNNYTPYYVRLFEKDYPLHVGFFEKRRVNKNI